MALTAFQRSVCRIIAAERIRTGDSYVAGGTALNAISQSSRISRDIDVFHDTTEAVRVSWENDRRLLTASGCDVEVVRDHVSFVEAVVRSGSESVVLQWAPDSAFRFFPLVEHPDFGLTLHPFDLATNKVLALVGRLEARDWVDMINSDARIQPLGYLAWAACGKDPGFSPLTIVEQAARSGRYSAAEIAALSFDGPAPDAGQLSRDWRVMLEQARRIIEKLPADQAGQCVLDQRGELLRLNPDDLDRALQAGQVQFHPGCLRGSLPALR